MDTALNLTDLNHALDGCAAGVAVEWVFDTGSTNADLMARASGLTQPTVRIAERQSAGRGRAGRTWHSAPGASLTFSLAWPFRGALSRLLGLPLAVGVALAESLAALAVPATLKWPNDILLEGRKLGGILIETAVVDGPVPGTTVWAVIGIGLNLELPDDLQARIGQQAAAAGILAQQDRARLMAKLVRALADAMMLFDAQGFAAFRERWNSCHAHAGMAVTLTEAGQMVQQGVALGVDEMGRLLLDTQGGPIAVLAGDVSLRTAQAEGAP